VTEYDPDRGFGDTVTCRIVTGPGWLLFDPKRNVLLGVPRIDDVGDTVTVLQADDGKGGIGRQAFTIHVAEAAPDVAAPNYVIPVPSFDIPFTMPMRPFVFLWPRAVVAAGAAVEEWSIQVSGRGVDTVVRGIRDTSVSVNLKNTIRPSSQYTWYLRARIDGRDTTVGGPYAFVTSSASRLVVISSLIPEKYLLYQNYPNPFNGGTVIRFALPVQSEVSLKLYNILGQEVKNLLQDNLVAGYQELYWEPVSMATGTYFIVMRAKGLENDQKEFCAVKKLLYLK
jgi:hypothetical protein